MFSRYVTVLLIGLAILSIGSNAETAEVAGRAVYAHGVDEDSVTGEKTVYEKLFIFSQEDKHVSLFFNLEEPRCWFLMNEAPHDNWTFENMVKKDVALTYQGSDMHEPASMNLFKAQAESTKGLASLNMEDAYRMLVSDQLSLNIFGKTYTFDLTQDDVVQGRRALKRILKKK